jgi:glycosyltransferase involved in cell wall biosynthesis
MWNYNEGDILEEIIESAVNTDIDCLWIADDKSTDNSWEIIKAAKKKYPKIEYIRREPIKGDKGQRQAMLSKIQERYKAENTWVQIIESDIMICDTKVREAIKNFAIDDLAVSWHTINCSRRNWEGYDTYPVWEDSIKNIMNAGSRMEVMLYTFRPFPNLIYDGDRWRPWPKGFVKHCKKKLDISHMHEDAPLLAHYGYRGPTHFYLKYKHMGAYHRKYRNWELDSPESVAKTVSWFNGRYRARIREVSREGWKIYVRGVLDGRRKINSKFKHAC